MQWFSLILLAIAIELTSQSEILIIRHGRSRSRHSVEKDHVRWGLKALDNLTIGENHEEFLESDENETNDELNVVSFYENNGTLSQSSEFNSTLGSFEINYTHSPSLPAKGSEAKSNRKHYHEWYHQQIPPTTEIPKSALTSPSTASIAGKHRNGRKKEIMTNIKNTVNKGIEYLKTHENLDEIKIEINEFHKKRAAKSNKMKSQSMLKTDQAPSSSSFSSSSAFVKQQQQRKLHSSKQIKINGGKELGVVTIVGSEPMARANPSMKLKKPSEKGSQQRHAANKHIKNHLGRNQLDLNINTNLADVFYIPTSTEDNPFNGVNEQMQGDEPAAVPDNESKLKSRKMMPINESAEQKAKRLMRKDETVASVGGGSNQTTPKLNKTLLKVDDKKTRTINSSGDLIHLRAEMFHELTTPDHLRFDDTDNNQPNDENSNDEDFINAISMQNDDGSSNSENVDIDDVELEGAGNFNGIDATEELSDDFDETSRNNRKNLMRGRDVVTRFLQIVESQHILGGNCTAGTALNLGEGVVDRYAQDRFRIEAEVAVNRANMLTR